MPNSAIQDALEWLSANDIPCYEADGSIFVQCGDSDLELSVAEIAYRAELQRMD